MLKCVLGRMRCGEGRALGFSREEGEGEEGLEGARGNMCIVYRVSCIVLCMCAYVRMCHDATGGRLPMGGGDSSVGMCTPLVLS